MIYYDPNVIAHKKLKPISKEEVADAFATSNVEVYTESNLSKRIKKLTWRGKKFINDELGNLMGRLFKIGR